MIDIMNALQTLKGDRRGVTAIEYGLIATLIALAIVTAATGVGTELSTVFGNVTTHL